MLENMLPKPKTPKKKDDAKKEKANEGVFRLKHKKGN